MQLVPKVLKRDEAKRGLKVDTVITYTMMIEGIALVAVFGSIFVIFLGLTGGERFGKGKC
jgi:hypothetical protein